MNEDKALVVVRGGQMISADSRRRLLARWAASGLSARAFAVEAGVKMHQLYEWRRSTQREESAPVTFVEVPCRGAATWWAAEVATRSGTVQLSVTAQPAWAAQLVRELNRC